MLLYQQPTEPPDRETGTTTRILPNENLNIRLLLQQLAATDSEEELRSLYMLYYSAIVRYISLYIKSGPVVEELVSDVFLAVWNQRKKLPEVDHFTAYLYKIAKNKMLNHLRSVKSVVVDIDDVSIDLFACTSTTPEDNYISTEAVTQINDAIEQLPAKCKIAFKLVREDKLKYKEAADILGISIKTLEAHLAAAMRKIREKLDIP